MFAANGIKYRVDNTFPKPLDFGSLKLFQIGELSCEPTFQIPEHKQWCHEISYIISGDGLFYDNDRQIVATAGDLIITPKNHRHAITVNSCQPLYFAYLGFDFETPMDNELLSLSKFYSQTHQLQLHQVPDIYPAFSKCIDEFYNAPQHSRRMIESYLFQIILSTKRFNEQALRKKQKQAENAASSQIIYQLIRYIDRNIYALKKIQDIASDIGYTNCYISHIFKKATGMTLQQYISSKRIEKSIELLLMDKFSVTVIAEKMSYANIQSFSRAFKRITGLYPSQYLNAFKTDS